MNVELECWGGGQPSFSLLKALEASALSKELVHFLLTGTGRRDGGFLSKQEVGQKMQFLILLIVRSPEQDNILINHIWKWLPLE